MRTFHECDFCGELYSEELEVIRVATVERETFTTTSYVRRFAMKAVCEDCKGSLGIKEPA